MIIGISGKIGSGKDTVTKIILELIQTKIATSTRVPIQNWKIRRFADKLKDIICIFLGCTKIDLENQEFKDSLLSDDWQVFNIYNFGKLMARGHLTFYTEKEARDFCIINSSSQHRYSYKKSERTVRWIMQYVGTDLFRDKIHNNAHVSMLFNEYQLSYKNNPAYDNKGIHDVDEEFELRNPQMFPNWIIPDVRFFNEAEKVKEEDGILIRLNRKVYHWKDKNRRFYTREAFIELYEGLESDIETPKHESETALDSYNNSFHYCIDNNGTIDELTRKVDNILKNQKLI